MPLVIATAPRHLAAYRGAYRGTYRGTVGTVLVLRLGRCRRVVGAARR